MVANESTIKLKLMHPDRFREEFSKVAGSGVGDGGGVPYKQANVATDMTRRLGEVDPGARVRVTGYSGRRLDEKVYKPWASLVEAWLACGARVQYLLVNMQEDDVTGKVPDHISKLAQKGVQFYVFKDDASECMAPIELAMVERMQEFHFTITDKPARLWLEHNHPAQSKSRAYNCEFLPEEVAGHHPLYGICDRWFEKCVSEYCRVLAPPQC